MDRRSFFKGMIGSGALGAMPLAARAGMRGDYPRSATPVVVVGQADLPPVGALVRSIVGSLAAAGQTCIQLTARSTELGCYGGVAAILDRVPQASLIGVMDDASALIFQQIAAARGAGWLMQVHHRIVADEVRHCCTVAGMESGLAWVDATDRHAQGIARLYVQAVSGRRPAPGERTVAQADAGLAEGQASFVSFAITT